MITPSQIKHIRQLQLKKFRREFGQFVCEGDKNVRELLDSGFSIDILAALPKWLQKHPTYLKKAGLCVEVSEKELERISGQKTPNQVLAVARIPDSPYDEPHGIQIEALMHELKENQKLSGATPIIIALDCIQDPGNFGTIMRTADWFGIRFIICSPDSADVYSPKVVQASMGSITRIRVVSANLPELLKKLATRTDIYAATLNGKAFGGPLQDKPLVLVIGNESKGISGEVLKHVSHQVTIPGHPGAESLNAAVAAGILMSWLSNPMNKNQK